MNPRPGRNRPSGAIPLELYGGDHLPPDIRSAWLFALRKGFAHPPER